MEDGHLQKNGENNTNGKSNFGEMAVDEWDIINLKIVN